MDFSVIFQLRTKKFWWMDVIFYLVISLLIASVFCWIIFIVKNNIQRGEIKTETDKLQVINNDQQKGYEADVINYQKKISDFTGIFQNHEFASNIFAFMQAQTMPNVWFNQFNLDEKNSSVQLSGESSDMDAFSVQVAALEKNKYVKSLGTLDSLLGKSARVKFDMNLTLDQNIFSYISDMTPILQTVSPSTQAIVQQTQMPPANNTTAAPSTGSQQVGTKSSEKLITSFHLLLTPDVAGVLSETNYTVTLTVPYGTDITNLTSEIVTSPKATVFPASNVSQDFTNPVTYIVTAEDGLVQSYSVRVIVAPQVQIVKKSNPAGLIITIIISLIVIAGAGAAIFFFLKKRSKNQKINTNRI
jgi:hypothetical protein